MSSSVKILVISDTHRNISNSVDIINSEKPDYVFHLGDMADDADELRYIFPRIDVIGVCGNCDWPAFNNAPVERFLDIDDVKILMCHGHTYSVKSGVGGYVSAARERGADIALFGHTHIPLLDNMGDIIIMNPGTVKTYGIIEIKDGKADARMCAYEE